MKIRSKLLTSLMSILITIPTFAAEDAAGPAQAGRDNAAGGNGREEPSLFTDMAEMAGIPAERAQRVAGAFTRMVDEVEDQSFIDTLGLTKIDALQMIGSVATVGFNCKVLNDTRRAIDSLSTISNLGEGLGECCHNMGAEWAAGERTTEFARSFTTDPVKLKDLLKAGKLDGAANPVDWCRQKCDPLFDAVNKPVKWLGMEHISDDARSEIRTKLESCGDAYARNSGFNPTTERQKAMNQQFEEASKAAGFKVNNSTSNAPNCESKQAELEETISNAQKVAQKSVFRVFIAGQALVTFVQFNQLLSINKSLADAQISIDGTEEVIETISEDFQSLRDIFDQLNIIETEIDPDPQTQVRLMRTINILQRHIQALDRILAQKVAELETLKNHVLEPKGRASVHSAVFNFVSAATAMYTTSAMGMVGADKVAGYAVGCAQAGVGIGNSFTACKAYKQIKTVRIRLATLTSAHEMFELILERLGGINQMGA